MTNMISMQSCVGATTVVSQGALSATQQTIASSQLPSVARDAFHSCSGMQDQRARQFCARAEGMTASPLSAGHVAAGKNPRALSPFPFALPQIVAHLRSADPSLSGKPGRMQTKLALMFTEDLALPGMARMLLTGRGQLSRRGRQHVRNLHDILQRPAENDDGVKELMHAVLASETPWFQNFLHTERDRLIRVSLDQLRALGLLPASLDATLLERWFLISQRAGGDVVPPEHGALFRAMVETTRSFARRAWPKGEILESFRSSGPPLHRAQQVNDSVTFKLALHPARYSSL